jgi:hypothetical protein
VTFKFEFESNEFAIYKKIENKKGFTISLLGFGPKPCY